MQHRDSQKRYHQENKAYFITFNVDGRKEFFREELFCELFIAELKLVKELKKFKLHAFAVNPDHVHLLLTPGKEYNISEIMQSLKRNFSRNVNKIIFDLPISEGEDPYPRHLTGDIRECRLQLVFENFKNNFINLKTKFNQKYPKHNLFKPVCAGKFKWQSSYRDHVIRDRKDYDHHLHYTIYNNLKHGLSENYKYTSLNYPDMIDLEIIW
jgi:REP element-mobilizing transposase RayT